MSFHTPAHKNLTSPGACVEHVQPRVDVECDFRYVDHGNIVILTPVTPRAKIWAREYEPFWAAATWGHGYVIEHRDYANVVDAIDAAGLYFAAEGR